MSGSRWATPEQARALLDIQLRPAFGLLMRAEYSAAELARALEVSVQRAHHLLTRLLKLDLVSVVAVTRRAGRPVRRYGMHDDWYVPFDVTQAATLAELIGDQILPRTAGLIELQVRALFAQAEVWGFRLWVPTGDSGTSLGLQDTSGRAPFELAGGVALLQFTTVHLLPEEARLLRSRLEALWDGLTPGERPGARAYSLGLLLAEGELS